MPAATPSTPDVPPRLDVPPVVAAPETVRIRVACGLLGLGEATVRELCREGELESFMFGSVRLITLESIRAFVRRRLAAAAALEARKAEHARKERLRRNLKKRELRAARKLAAERPAA